MKLVFDTKTKGNIKILLKRNRHLVDETDLTISQDLDILLITAIDKLLKKNKIERLSLNYLKIGGKIDDKALWGMVLKTVKTALEI